MAFANFIKRNIRKMRRFAPKSLYSRFVFIIVLPVLISQLVAIYIFYERHWDTMSRYMTKSLSGEVALIVSEFKHAPKAEYERIIQEAVEFLVIKISYEDGTLESFSPEIEPQYNDLAKALSAHFDNEVSIITVEDKRIHLTIPLDKGVLYLETTHKKLASPTTYIFVMWMTGTTLLLTMVALLFLRNQVRSIVRLSTAAERFGRGLETPKFKPQGAEEVRRAAVAFIEMKERIRRLLSRRTEMLAGISHDLRTPLTRMRLQLEMIDDPSAKVMLKDVKEMEQMISAYLDFARGTSQEKTKKVNLEDFFKELLSRYEEANNVEIDYSIDPEIMLDMRESAFKRGIGNMLDNAVRFASKISVRASKKSDGSTGIIIEDNGPGIEEGLREKVFTPFFRVDSSRNSDTGGAGLGLSIARDAIHVHGGTIELASSKELGGLKVVIKLP